MLLAEFDEEQYRREVAEEGYEKGRSEGIIEGSLKERRNTIFRMFDKGMTDDDICDFYWKEISSEELENLRTEWINRDQAFKSE